MGGVSTERLEEILSFYGINESETKARQLARYLEAVEEKRDWAGLVSKGLGLRPEAAVSESVAAAAELGNAAVASVADIGAGGGLLGLVIAIVWPGAAVTMVESSTRKAAFLLEAKGALGLEKVSVINKRAEALAGSQAFEAVVSRAAGRLSDVAPVALALVESGGRYLALKSSEPQGEIDEAGEAIRASGGKVIDVLSVDYPPSISFESGASLVILQKL